MKILGTIWNFLTDIPWQIWATIALVVVFVLWGNFRYEEGREDEVARQERIAAAAKEELRVKERKAADVDEQLRRSGLEKVTTERKELDDAKRNIPDQGLSARQRARACAELRKAGRPCATATSSPSTTGR